MGMRYLVSGSQMKEVDSYTIQSIGIPSLVLMEQAAAAMGVYLHGRAGDLVKLQSGEHGLLARELTEALADIIKS